MKLRSLYFSSTALEGRYSKNLTFLSSSSSAPGALLEKFNLLNFMNSKNLTALISSSSALGHHTAKLDVFGAARTVLSVRYPKFMSISAILRGGM